MALRRGVALVIASLALAILISAAGVLLVYLMVSREPAVPRQSTLVLPIEGELHEIPPGDIVGQVLRGPSPPTLPSIVESLRKAKVDSRMAGVLLVPRNLAGAWAGVQELRDAVADFRRSGKPIVGYLEFGGEREYYLASACSRVFLMPTSPLELNGLATYELFLRGTLDKIGAYPDLLHIGEYKTAPNQLTEKTFTAEHREMAEWLNRDLFEQLVRGIADGRNKSEADVRALLDEGPFLPEDAVRVGLVDDLAYEDQIDDKVKFGDGPPRLLDAKDYARVGLESLGLGRGPRIALVYAVGAIHAGKSGFDPLAGQLLGSDTIVEHVRTARADPAVRAIVLRIDSPGGSSIASDVIWRELQLTRSQKPLIVSMGDLAGSGGYYIAMPGHQIVAQPGTLTGSIGIYGGKIVTGGTYAKLGANIESVASGRYADMNSPARPYSPDERRKIAEQLEAFYDQFVEKAAQARNTTPERIDAIGQGRVWTGRQARRLGLVDELGGLDRAMALAKQRAKIPLEQEVELVVYPPARSLYEILTEQLYRGGGPSIFGGLLAAGERHALEAVSGSIRWFRRGEPLALMPYIGTR